MCACQPALNDPWPKIRSTSRRSRTRRHIRTSICARTALLPMACWVGRCVAASNVTATARPRRASRVRVFLRLVGELRVFVNHDHQCGHIRRWFPHAAARCGHAARRGGPVPPPLRRTAPWLALVWWRAAPGIAPRAAVPCLLSGPRPTPRRRCMRPGTRGYVHDPGFPGIGDPADQDITPQDHDADGPAVFEQSRGLRVWLSTWQPMPGQGIGWACGSVSMTRSVNRSARRGIGDSAGAAGSQPSPDSISGNLSMAWAAVVPFRRITRAVQPHLSATIDAIREPGRPMSSATVPAMFVWCVPRGPWPVFCGAPTTEYPKSPWRYPQ